MSPKPLYPLWAILFLASCQEPAQKGATGKTSPASQSQPASLAADSEESPEDTPEDDDLTLALDVDSPTSEPTPKAPAKSDPQCEATDAPGKTPLSPKDQEAVLKAYLEIQQSYLEREKGASGFELKNDPQNPLSYQLLFKDLLGTPGKMTYKLGKTIIDEEDRITLCLDEGQKLLWAGTYRREGGKFVPDL